MPSVPRRPGRPTAEHQAAVARRLDLLRAELAATPALRVVPDPTPEATGGDMALDPWWSASTRIPGVADSARLVAEPVPEPAEPVVDPVLGPARLPLPGRHASRRRRDLVEALVPETLRGRVLIGPAQLTVVAVLVCLGLAVLAWSTVRSRPEVVAPQLASAATTPLAGEAVSAAPVVALPSAAPSAAAIEAAAPAATQGGSITVDVAGKVRRPGIAVLASGARVVDAIAAAGGARQGVDLTPLNLARPLVDGEQIVVGIDPPPGVAAAALASPDPGGASSAAAGALVDLNTATDAELDTLPDVGPVTAQSIITWREEHGGFTTVDELLEVSGIGEATLAKLAPHVTV